MQAVEKALSRAAGVTLKEIVDELGIGSSTLGKWMRNARNNDRENVYVARQSQSPAGQKPVHPATPSSGARATTREYGLRS